MSGIRRAAVVLGFFVAAVTAYHYAFTLSTLLSYGLHHPLQDEFRMTHKYLVAPFPESILTLEQGHRPVIPAFLRWIELHGMAGSHLLQASLAALAGLGALWLVGREAWNGLREERLLQVCAVALGTTLLLWNANARMFFHVPEAAHTVLAAAGVVLAMWAAARALEGGCAPCWWSLSLLACVVATFSIGPGVASFAGVVTIALIGRARWPVVVAIGAASVMFFLLYAVVLPGSAEVRGAPSLRDLDASLMFWMIRMGAVAAELTRHKEAVSLASAMLSIAMIVLLITLRLRGHPFSRLEAFSAGLFAFGAVANAAIASVRKDYFYAHPDQIYAERYLIWTCMAWAGMGVFAFSRLAGTSPRRQLACAAVLLLFLAALFPPAKRVNGWAADRYTEVELAAAVLRIGAKADQPIARVVDRGVDEAYDLEAAMRSRQLGDFRHGADIRIGTRLRFDSEQVPTIPATKAPIGGVTHPSPLFRLSAPLSDPRFGKASLLWLVEPNGRVVGSAFLAPTKSRSPWQLGLGRFDRLDGCLTGESRELLLVETVGAQSHRLRARLILS